MSDASQPHGVEEPAAAPGPDGPVEFECADLAVRLDMELPGHPTAITPVVDRVLGLVRETGCAPGKEFEVETALREALANAVRHGCAHNPGKRVQLSVGCDHARGISTSRC